MLRQSITYPFRLVATGQLSDRVKNANLFRFIEGGKLIC